jgi:UDP-glucuronate decarboxylase
MTTDPHMLLSDVDQVVSRLGETAQAFNGKTVLITGGRGFLGRYFVAVFARLNESVLKEPVKVIALDNLITSRQASVREYEHVTFVQHDVIQPYVHRGPLDYVIHAAGIASPFYYRAYPLETLDVAITGTRNMLTLATQAGARFTFFSSSEIYGDPDARHVPMAESYRGNVASQGPRACYDESKRVGETLTYIFHTKYGTATSIIRPFNVFGPGMHETDYRVLPNFAHRIKAGQPLNVYGSGSQTRTFCYITDALVGFLLVVLKGVPGETYNIGNPEPEVSMVDLVRALERAKGEAVPYNLIEYPDSYPADEPMRRSPDIRKARLQLEFDPQVELEDGLRRFLTWALATYSGKI